MPRIGPPGSDFNFQGARRTRNPLEMATVDELPEGEEFRDEELPGEDLQEESSTAECPRCGRQIYEDSERCPSCGNYVTPGAPEARKERLPWWVILGLLLIATLVLGWLFLR